MAQYPARARVTAWAVYILTMSGLVWTSPVVSAIIHPRREFMWMWVWLSVALVIGDVDGILARHARVSEIIPWFDDDVIDIVVDHLTQTFILVVLMYVVLPTGPRSLTELFMTLILNSSMLCYANKQWKSTDYYFMGFPTAWNIVALMSYALQTSAASNIIVTLALMVLTPALIHYAHPACVKRFHTLNIGAVAVWFLVTCWLMMIYPHRLLSAVVVLIVSGEQLLLAGVLRSTRGEEPTAIAAQTGLTIPGGAQPPDDRHVVQPMTALQQEGGQHQVDDHHDDSAEVLTAMPVVARREEVHVGRYEGDEGDEGVGEADAVPLARHHGDDPPGVGYYGDDVDSS